MKLEDQSSTARRKQIIVLASCVVLILAIIVLTIYQIRTLRVDTNSDIASELILARQLAQEGKIITDSWYYSTELRVLNTNLIYAPLFRLFSSWYTIRLVGTLSLYGLLLLLAWLVCKESGTAWLFPIVGIMLITPVSGEYYSIVLQFPYYIPHVAITLTSLILLLMFSRNQKPKWMTIELCVAGGGLAFVAGLGGARQVIICYIPLFISILSMTCYEWRGQRPDIKGEEKRKKELLFSILTLLLSGAGYIVSEIVLRQKYSFRVFQVEFINFSIDRLSVALAGLLSSFGYLSGKISLKVALRNITGTAFFLSSIFSAIRIIKKEQYLSRIIGWFYLSAIVVFLLLFSFTDMYYENRYNLPIITVAPFVIALWVNSILKTKIQNVVYLIWMILLIVSTSNFYLNHSVSKTGAERIEIANYLIENDYHYGYGTFWNANVMTELTDGAIEMHDWDDNFEYASGDVDRIYKWLQLKEHSSLPKGKVFLLFSNNQVSRNLDPENDNPNLWRLDVQHLIYKTEGYCVYGYDDYDTMKSSIYRTDE